MKIDSLITAEVLKVSTDIKVPVLSVHDSYIISFYDVALLLELMREATKKVVGSYLAVSQEALSYDDYVDIYAPDRVAGQDDFSDLYKEASTLDLSRFSAAPNARLSHFSFESDGAFPTQC